MSQHFILMTVADEARETLRDVIRQMAVHDGSRFVRRLAEAAYRGLADDDLSALEGVAHMSAFGGKFVTATNSYRAVAS